MEAETLVYGGFSHDSAFVQLVRQSFALSAAAQGSPAQGAWPKHRFSSGSFRKNTIKIESPGPAIA